MKKNTDLRSVDGQTVHLPQEIGGNVGAGNIALPNIYTEDSVQQYPIGTRLVVGERTLHYFKAGMAIPLTLLGVLTNLIQTATAQDSYDTAQAAGVGTAANPFKVNGTGAGAPVKDAYANHLLAIMVSTDIGIPLMRVISNTAGETDSPYTVELVLDQPTPVAVAADTDCEFYASRYADVRVASSGDPGNLDGALYPFVGRNMRPMTSGFFGWLQTWGPCMIVNTNTAVGDTEFGRAVVFSTDGSIEPCHEAWHSDVKSSQIAGYSLACNGAGSAWIQLTLDR